MRGVYSSVTDIRRKIFTEIARMAYDGDYSVIKKLSYKIKKERHFNKSSLHM